MSAGQSYRHKRAKLDLPYRPAVLTCPLSQEQSEKMSGYLRLDAFRSTPLVKEPFEHLIVSGFVDPAGLAAVNADYPKISTSGSFPVDQVSFGPAFSSKACFSLKEGIPGLGMKS